MSLTIPDVKALPAIERRDSRNLTITDVLAHPAIKRLVFTKNKMDIERMRDTLKVLVLYDELQSIYKRGKLSDLVPIGDQKKFLHFKECPWTDKDAITLPNTCYCSHVHMQCTDILDILDKLNLDVETQRLKSFTTQWPHSSPTPEDLAAAGFYYLGKNDSVRCCFCGVEIRKWEKDDNPMISHKKVSPSCPHVNRRKTTHVSI